ncbi:hypothetical protein H072_4744 [Dactylellina haptotyla CBS 200.50]|uniref:Uncharacterized protein n=1 Tax=Dactylellina haptotyla (strain CBS 200.50) TaxID=1284197 RepID=S8AJS2_DACHA|nr:hypothetical protein H072_4744 [Dactylellina haptotyla CBS 200.50]
MSDHIGTANPWAGTHWDGWGQNFAPQNQNGYFGHHVYPTGQLGSPTEKQIGGIESFYNPGGIIDENFWVRSRRPHWIIAICVGALVLAGLGVGLGVGLGTKKQNDLESTKGTADSKGVSQTTSTVTGLASTSSNLNGHKVVTVEVTSLTTFSEPSSGPVTGLDLLTGVHTICLTLSTTSGDPTLCANLVQGVPSATTIYPTVTGDVNNFYTASWYLTGYPSTVTAVGSPPEATGNGWYFEIPAVQTILGNCAMEAQDTFIIRNTGKSEYVANLLARNRCNLGNESIPAGDLCQLILSGNDYNVTGDDDDDKPTTTKLS